MKLLSIWITLILALFSFNLLAQVPESFNYQAVARYSDGNIIPDQKIGLRVSILEESADGNIVYSETHTPTTNQSGLFTLVIGTGNVVTGVFTEIKWQQNYKFLKIEMDPHGCSNYILSGTFQILSVPYALQAGNIDVKISKYGDTLTIGKSKVVIPGLSNSNASEPAVSTNKATNITSTGATVGSTVSDDGGSTVTRRGIVFNTSPNPTISDSKIESGLGTGSVSILLSDLTGGTKYYARAFATNSAGTAYGNEICFTTITSVLATLQTAPADQITFESAVIKGKIVNNGDSKITESGFCFGTSPEPAIESTHISAEETSGNFSSTLLNLQFGTTYYVRSFAINNAGVAYGNEISFTTVNIKVPTVQTKGVSEFYTTSLLTGGIVSSDGGAPVIEKGVVWSTVPVPTINDFKKIDSADGPSDFGSLISELPHGTTFYFRAYAINKAGVGYGNEVKAATVTGKVPSVTRFDYLNCNDFDYYYGYLEAPICHPFGDDGGFPVTETGIVYGFQPEPTVETGTRIINGTYMGNMQPGKTYYVRGYATNKIGTGYGWDKTLTNTQQPVFHPLYTLSTLKKNILGNSSSVKVGYEILMNGIPANGAYLLGGVEFENPSGYLMDSTFSIDLSYEIIQPDNYLQISLVDEEGEEFIIPSSNPHGIGGISSSVKVSDFVSNPAQPNYALKDHVYTGGLKNLRKIRLMAFDNGIGKPVNISVYTLVLTKP